MTFVRGVNRVAFADNIRVMGHLAKHGGIGTRGPRFALLIHMNSNASAQGAVVARVLLVDDDQMLAKAYERVLRAAGFSVTVASSGAGALELIDTAEVDVVLTDCAMPQMTGVQLMQALRARGSSVPVVMMTGLASVESAIGAIEQSVVRYLLKPVELEELLDAVRIAARQSGRAEHARRMDDQRVLTSALASLWMAYQPIVRATDQSVVAYEALLRSKHPVLSTAPLLVQAAARMGRMEELGSAVRLQVARMLAEETFAGRMFVNVDPTELQGEDLYSSRAPLARYAQRVVLEITERVSLEDVKELAERMAALRALGYRVAIDDLGSGHSGLQSLIQLRPDIVKVDMSLVRGVERDPLKQSIIAALAQHCRFHGVEVVAEGVETESERDMLLSLGCDFLQGYLIGRPLEHLVEARSGRPPAIAN